MEGQQFHQVIRPVHRAVDPRPRPLEHPALGIAEVEDQELGLPPLDADLAAVLHPLAFLGLDLRPDAEASPIDLGDDVLPPMSCPAGSRPSRNRCNWRVRTVRTSAPNCRAIRWTVFSSSVGPWWRSSSRARSMEGSRAVKRPTWLWSAGVAPLRMPRAANSG